MPEYISHTLALSHALPRWPRLPQSGKERLPSALLDRLVTHDLLCTSAIPTDRGIGHILPLYYVHVRVRRVFRPTMRG